MSNNKGTILSHRSLTPLEEHNKRFKKRVEKVTEGVYSAVGYALANSILIVTEAGNIIVDTTESVKAAKEIKEEFDKISPLPTLAVIYTHGHGDHIHGTSVFANERTEIIANAKIKELFEKERSQLQPIMSVRSRRMHGIGVPEGLIPCSGLGPVLKLDTVNDPKALIPPTHYFDDSLELVIGGLQLQLVSAPGETDDQIYIWIPEKKVLISADNYYPAFPNLYTIRGTTPRPIYTWIESLDKMRDIGAEYLVPCHAEPVYGADKIDELLTMYRDAIQYVHDATVRGMNEGKTIDQLAEEIKLPPELAQYKELLELYGDISICVRAIFVGYIGWFDGNATNIKPLPRMDRAQKMAALAGGFEKMLSEAKAALERKEFQWAAEISDMLLALSPDSNEILHIKAAALWEMGLLSDNSNNKSYYLAQSLELKGELTIKPTPIEGKLAYADAITIEKFFANMTTLLNPVKCEGQKISASVRLTDRDMVYQIHVRRGIAEIRKGVPQQSDLSINTTEKTWKMVVLGALDVQEAVESKNLQFQDDGNLLRTFIDLFHS